MPTLAEGCCNAIVEAMACGLPIISSNLSFNDDVLEDAFSIRIDPKNVKEIKEAILKLFNDKELRESMSKKAIEKAKTLTINQRAKNIIAFMEEKIGEK